MRQLTEDQYQERLWFTRMRVMTDLAELVHSADAVGSRDQFGRRLRSVLEARDPVTLRAAVMGVAESAANWVVQLDVSDATVRQDGGGSNGHGDF